MIRISILFAAVSILASCNSDQKTSTETTKDVVGVSDSNLYKNNAMADTGHFAPAPVAPVAPVNNERRVVAEKAPRYKATPKRSVTKPVSSATPTDTKAVTPAPATGTGTTGTAGTGTTTAPSTGTASTTPEAVPEKKGWSNAAKGATIGGVGGAIGGAIISKKKGKGAIIGGAVGAAGGYILGRKKDKAQQAADTAQ